MKLSEDDADAALEPAMERMRDAVERLEGHLGPRSVCAVAPLVPWCFDGGEPLYRVTYEVAPGSPRIDLIVRERDLLLAAGHVTRVVQYLIETHVAVLEARDEQWRARHPRFPRRPGDAVTPQSGGS